MRKHIPNLLTLSRIALCPFIASAFFRGRIAETFLLLLIAGLTDFLDGFLSRRWHVTSILGSFLDPVCDKLYTVALFTSLMLLGDCPIWFLALLITVFLLQGAGVLLMKIPLSAGRHVIQPTRVGKTSTALQMLWSGSLVVENLAVRNGYMQRLPEMFFWVGFTVLAILQIYAFCQYVFRYRSRLAPGLLQAQSTR